MSVGWSAPISGQASDLPFPTACGAPSACDSSVRLDEPYSVVRVKTYSMRDALPSPIEILQPFHRPLAKINVFSPYLVGSATSGNAGVCAGAA